MTTPPSFGLSQTNASITGIDDCVHLLRMLQEKGLLGDQTVNRQRKWDTLEGLKTREFEGGVSSRTEGRVPKERSRRVPVTSRQSRGRRGADRADQVLRQTSQSSYPA